MAFETTIATLGFPIAMCLWFMFRSEKIISKNTDAIDNLALILKTKLK